MTSLRRLSILTSVLVGAAASVSFTVAGCGSSTSESGGTPDGATGDATQDSTSNDVVTPEDAAGGDADAGATQGDADATVPGDGDAAAQPDADAAQSVDADAAGQVDADAAGQLDADAAAQADGDAGFDAQALIAYANSYGAAWCQRLFACCGTDAGVDLQGCIDFYKATHGWENTLPGQSDLTGGKVQLDPDAGAACVSALGAFACPVSGAAQWANITTSCYAAVRGTIPIGQGPCGSSYECAPGSYCKTVSVDGGTASQCAALVGPGQNCDLEGDQACSYLGSSNTGYYCNLIDFPDGGATCQPLRDSGVYCTQDFSYYDDQACKAFMCGDDWKCGSNQTYPYSYLCTQWIVDAGGGG